MTATGPLIVTHAPVRSELRNLDYLVARTSPLATRELERADVLYRKAFATLDEARDAAWERANTPANTVSRDERWNTIFPASGGKLGPLPDGSVIEVAVASVEIVAGCLGNPHNQEFRGDFHMAGMKVGRIEPSFVGGGDHVAWIGRAGVTWEMWSMDSPIAADVYAELSKRRNELCATWNAEHGIPDAGAKR